MLIVWLKFAACATVIAFAGSALTRYGTVIASLTGLSRSWVGLVLLATATSLPELFTGLSAVTVAGDPDIAIGGTLGSCVFNLAMLVLLDALVRDEPMYRCIDQGHILTAGFGVIMIGIVGALLLARDQVGWRILTVSAYTPAILALYVAAMRAAWLHERHHPLPVPTGRVVVDITLRAAIARYAAAAVAVVAAGVWLPFVGIELADAMGWRTSFVGTLFVGAATSLPEVVVTISALRVGALDMAIANLLGSNLFDVLVIALVDPFNVESPLLAAASPVHAISAFAAVIMSGVFIVAVLYRPRGRVFGVVGWISVALLVVYLLSSFAIYYRAP